MDFKEAWPLHEDTSPWKKQNPEMAEYYKRIDERESFTTICPLMFELYDKVT